MINRYVERFETIPLDMLDDIIEQLRQNNNRTLLKSIQRYDHLIRCSIFPHKYVWQIHRICSFCNFDYNIMCYSIELFQRIMDGLLKDCHLVSMDNLLGSDLQFVMGFNVKNAIELPNIKLYSSVMQAFFNGMKDKDINSLINQSNSNRYHPTKVDVDEMFCDKYSTILSFVSVMLALKLNGRMSSFEQSQSPYVLLLEAQTKLSNLKRTRWVPLSRLFTRIENHVLQLLNFDLCINSLDTYIDAIIAKLQQKNLIMTTANLFGRHYQSQVRDLLSIFYYKRFSLAKHIFFIEQINQQRQSFHHQFHNQENQKKLEYDHQLMMLEYFNSDKLLLASVIVFTMVRMEVTGFDNQFNQLKLSNILNHLSQYAETGRIIYLSSYILNQYNLENNRMN
ncbi:hypothetical protein RDWZM_003715 [Blomia tropicalis]|uniref:Uncharacterized protein n=1 Tax=Blomia tropicalis TaxID=40697 RepID=A0A9Q0MJZ0_BLOTA|nr:hypothetical protein BLOT_002679 [Blomia tropicalis]KAJ6225170.1 hypothetical protein RDWZM_003715 [Blomia tropicalis]